MWGYGLDRAGLRQGQLADTCQCGNGTSVFVKSGGIYLTAENLLASEEGLCPMEYDEYNLIYVVCSKIHS